MSVSSKMKAIADEVRELTGATSTLTLDAMASNLGDANAEVGTQRSLITEIFDALEGKAIGGSDPVLQSKTVTPTTSKQTVTADSGYDGLSEVEVNAIPSNYIIPTGTLSVTTNGTHDIKNYESVNVNVSGDAPALQTKSVTPTISTQTIKPDTGYDGLSQVTVSGVGGTLEIDENGTYGSITSNDFYNRIIVNVPTNSGESGSSSILTSEVKPTSNSLSIQFTGLVGEPSAFSVQTNTNITLASTRYVVNVNYDGTETEGVCGYTSGTYNKTGTNAYSASDFTWTYADGTLTVTSSSATTGGYFTSSATYKLFYVTNAEVVGGSDGTTTEPKLQSKTVTPSETAQTITPDTGYDGLSQVEVEAVPTETKTITESGTYVPSNGKFFSQVTVTVPTGGGSSSDGLPDVITAGDTPILANWNSATVSNKTATDTGISLTMPKDGTYRFYIPAAKSSSYTTGTSNPTMQLYKNGTATGSAITVSSSGSAYTADIQCSANDVISVYATAAGSSYTTTSVIVIALVACINK